jgi:hypothetical protein
VLEQLTKEGLSESIMALIASYGREARIEGAEQLAELLKEGSKSSGSINVDEGLKIYKNLKKEPTHE